MRVREGDEAGGSREPVADAIWRIYGRIIRGTGSYKVDDVRRLALPDAMKLLKHCDPDPAPAGAAPSVQAPTPLEEMRRAVAQTGRRL